MAALERWNDDRLDDLAEEVRKMAEVVDGVGAMKVLLKEAVSNSQRARDNVHLLRGDMDAGLNGIRGDLIARETARQVEKKSDRRWMIGTALSCAALIVAAVGIIVGAL